MQRAEIEAAVEVARRAVQAGGAAALRHFRGPMSVETKADESPVTVADREAEGAIVDVIRTAYPTHGTLGEEGGAREGLPGTRWIIDPIDGTRGFARGGLFWGPLVALESEGRLVAAAAALPVSGVTFWAGAGLGCFRDGTRVHVSSVARLADATLSVGEVKRLVRPDRREGFLAMAERVASVRSYGDLAGCVQLLDGRAEAWVETGVQLWDLAPLALLVEEAGGRFTNWKGERSWNDGEAVASNGLVHDAVLALLRGGSVG